ncbi:MAG: ParB/RepB/Spo0J family partition protein [Planctomycetota bacterium]|nr:ParB/RepB/Spo0J family partition protein [Planctomycetota bacterium]
MSNPQPPAPVRRGLGALIQSTTGVKAPANTSVATAPLASIRANPDQPRKEFDEAALAELTDSIKTKGILQPIIVRPLKPEEIKGEVKYEIIAGERRWRASQRVGLAEVPVVVKEVGNSTDVLVLSLIENLQRDDLNPVEEAQAFKRLQQNFGMTQEDIAAAVGKSRAGVANAMRMLDLPAPVLQCVQDGKLTVGHAKILLSVGDPRLQTKLASKAVAEGWTVRQLELFSVDQPAAVATKTRSYDTHPKRASAPHIQDIEQKLRSHFGTKVHVEEGAKKGRIVVEFYSVEDFDRITGLMGLVKS